MPGSGHAGSAGVINLAWFCPGLGFRFLDLDVLDVDPWRAMCGNFLWPSRSVKE